MAANDASVADLDAVEAAEPQAATPDTAGAIDETPTVDALAAEDRGAHEGGARRRRGGRDRHRREERPADGEPASAERVVTEFTARMGEEAIDASAAIAQAEEPAMLPAMTLPLLEPVAAPVEPLGSGAVRSRPLRRRWRRSRCPPTSWRRSPRARGSSGSTPTPRRSARRRKPWPRPRPARVPRERKPVAAVDEGPLVLVETRKDLSQVKLPFETRAAGVLTARPNRTAPKVRRFPSGVRAVFFV